MPFTQSRGATLAKKLIVIIPACLNELSNGQYRRCSQQRRSIVALVKYEQKRHVFISRKSRMDIDATSDVDSKAYRALEAVTLSPLVIPLLFGVAVLVGGAAFVGEGGGMPQLTSLYRSTRV